MQPCVVASLLRPLLHPIPPFRQTWLLYLGDKDPSNRNKSGLSKFRSEEVFRLSNLFREDLNEDRTLSNLFMKIESVSGKAMLEPSAYKVSAR